MNMGAFARFARGSRAGGCDQAVYHPADDPNYIVVNLTFQNANAASAFREILREHVWSSPQAYPALVGQPKAVVLTEVKTD